MNGIVYQDDSISLLLYFRMIFFYYLYYNLSEIKKLVYFKYFVIYKINGVSGHKTVYLCLGILAAIIFLTRAIPITGGPHTKI